MGIFSEFSTNIYPLRKYIFPQGTLTKLNFAFKITQNKITQKNNMKVRVVPTTPLAVWHTPQQGFLAVADLLEKLSVSRLYMMGTSLKYS